MILLTIADLHQKYRPFPGQAYREYRRSLSTPEDPYDRFDVSLLCLGLSARVEFMVLQELNATGLQVRPTTVLKQEKKGNSLTEHVRELWRVSRAMLIAVPGDERLDEHLAWFVGHFDALSKGRIAALPVFRKDTSTEYFKAQGVLGRYPYIGFARAMGEDHDTAWVMRSPDKYVNIEYWMGLGGDSL